MTPVVLKPGFKLMREHYTNKAKQSALGSIGTGDADWHEFLFWPFSSTAELSSSREAHK